MTVSLEMEFQIPLIVAEFNLIEHINDHPWHGFTVQWGGHDIILMSSAIASMSSRPWAARQEYGSPHSPTSSAW